MANIDDAVITLEHTSEDDDVRIYAVNEAVEGMSVAVVANQGRTGTWNCEFQGPEECPQDDRNACVKAVSDMLNS